MRYGIDTINGEIRRIWSRAVFRLGFGLDLSELPKAIHDVGRNGYLRTQSGLGGEFTLEHAPKEIQSEDIVHRGEVTEIMIECTDRRAQPCRILPASRLKGVLDEAAAAFFPVLDGYTVADLLKRPSRMRAVLKI